jgi:hypothetical protein
MTSRFKDFGEDSNVVKEPLSFKLYGEEFHCVPAVQGKVLLDLVKKASDPNDPGAAAEVVDSFFEKTLTSESLERFNKLLEDPEKIVSVETLSEITAWLVAEYSERPTKEPERSSNGE